MPGACQKLQASISPTTAVFFLTSATLAVERFEPAAHQPIRPLRHSRCIPRTIRMRTVASGFQMAVLDRVLTGLAAEFLILGNCTGALRMRTFCLCHRCHQGLSVSSPVPGSLNFDASPGGAVLSEWKIRRSSGPPRSPGEVSLCEYPMSPVPIRENTALPAI